MIADLPEKPASMHRKARASLLRVTLGDRRASATQVLSGSLQDMIGRAVEGADSALWRYYVQIKGGPTLLPHTAATLHARWRDGEASTGTPEHP